MLYRNNTKILVIGDSSSMLLFPSIAQTSRAWKSQQFMQINYYWVLQLHKHQHLGSPKSPAIERPQIQKLHHIHSLLQY